MESAPRIDGERLRAARERAGLTQHQLARTVGVVGGERVSMWERELARPRTPRLLHAVAEAVGVAVGDLLVDPPGGPDLRWLRFAAGLDVDDVARAAHVSVASLKRWESGATRRPLTDAAVAALAAVLRVEPSVVTSAAARR